ncbi:hypothetical protein G7Y89_g6025 [Cudoniella acicularis]|uniref:CRAL-TRIO domain-containing protein n=1 Tax=Cudoniella acicularis TaxID=354080 RepID=A0A8H4RNK0_9HELO|nr:hypothetical protein G7Y89_g6025 [Cudoniella acicularis]
MLRFLRARRFVVPDAFKQFQETEDWRKANELDMLYETIDLEHYEETRRLVGISNSSRTSVDMTQYPQWTGRRDRRGIPVYVFEVKHLNSKTMAAYEKSALKTHTKAQSDGKTSPKLMRLFALYENLVRFVLPLCTALTDRDHPRTPITQSNNIVDISGVGLKQFWNLRTHMQDASTLATAHYPETLDRIFIIGAPAFFPTVWGWIKKWFDPITTSKIFILSSHDMKKTLESFIDPENIPKKYGGKLEFQFGDRPVLDPVIQKITKWEGGRDNFPEGPMFWVDNDKEGKAIKAIAVGSVQEGEERREDVCVLTRDLPDPIPVENTEEKINGHATAPGEGISATATLVTSEEESEKAPKAAEEETEEKPATTIATTSTPEAEKAPIPTPVSPKQQTPQQEIEGENPIIQSGELIPPSRPEPVSFVTASEDLPSVKDLALDEKVNGQILVGQGHSTVTANLLDPSLHVGEEVEGAK